MNIKTIIILIKNTFRFNVSQVAFIFFLSVCSVFADECNRAVFAQREDLLKNFHYAGIEAAPVLEEALNNENALVSRTAAHLLVRLGENALQGVEKALENPDFQVRRIAIDGLASMGRLTDYWQIVLMDTHHSIRRDVQTTLLKEHPLPEGQEFDLFMKRFAQAFDGAADELRLHLVEMIQSLDMTPQLNRLLIKASADPNQRIRERAFEHLSQHIDIGWKEAAALLAAALDDSSETIREIGLQMRWNLQEVKRIRLPKTGWRFRVDPDEKGRQQEWFAVDYDDGEWRDDVPIEANWQAFMEQQYNGSAWYRRVIEVPPLPPEGDKIYLDFRSVDEQAWVWLNGEFVGSHEMGPSGWNIPFQIEVTQAIKSGEANQISVLASNTRGGAGIWEPVFVIVLDTTRTIE